MQNNIDLNELVKIEQMPKIFSELEKIGKWVDKGLKDLDLDNIVADESHKQELKKTRTEINTISKTLEAKRKEIKTKILEPYEMFNKKYEEEVSNKLNEAATKLTDTINIIETKQKEVKEQNLKEFFDNYAEYYHVEDIVKFEDANLNITLSASEKSLKDKVLEFLKRVTDDMEAISSFENREEVLLEYKKNGFNYSQAINTINIKQKELKQLEENMKIKDEIIKHEQNIIQNVKTLVSEPKEVVEEEMITVQFTVTSTLEKLKKLKEFMQKEGIKYE